MENAVEASLGILQGSCLETGRAAWKHQCLFHEPDWEFWRFVSAVGHPRGPDALEGVTELSTIINVPNKF